MVHNKYFVPLYSNMNIKSIILLGFMFLFFGSIHSQSQKQLIQYADENFELGDFYGASIYYQKAMKMDSANIHLLYKYATSLRYYNNYTDAQYYYAKIVEKDNGGRIYQDAIFWLAMMQKNNADYKEASKSFKRAKSLYSKNKKEYIYLKSDREIASCNWANRSKNEINADCSVTNLGDKINTTQAEFSAFQQGEKLYFSSLRASKISESLEILTTHDYKTAIYEATFNETWETKSKIDSNINSILSHNANGCFNSNGTVFYFTRCDSLNACKLYASKFTSGKWSAPALLPDKINDPSATKTTQPNIAIIGRKEFLIFVSDRNGGQGNLDIWFAEILDGGTFGKPQNAGSKINSPDPDITPFYHQKENALYFSSSWHNGFGGFDIFKSQGPLESLSEPENLLPPINTQWNDFYFTIDSLSSEGFLTSNRLGVFYEKGPTCCNDIWSVNIAKEELITSETIETLDDINKYLPVTLYFHNDRPGPRSLDTTVNDNYLLTYEKYKALQQTYRDEYSNGLVDEQKDEAIYDIDDYFKNYVDKGVDDLELFSRLLLAELDKGEKIEVTIKGFASPLAKSDYNVKLTQRRISTFINYLRAYGNGEFNDYIDKTAKNGGFLTFLKIPFGEYTANPNVSDDYHDQKNSIYNRKAALERKIEIQSITYAEKDENFAGLTVSDGTFDFGKIKQGEKVKHTFVIENTGNIPLEIVDVDRGCECNQVNFSKEPIPPGEKGFVEVTFDATGLSGKQVKSITVIGNSFPKTKRLVITSEVFD
jgi:tetratricopeptide (TPR) repeat protein